MGEKLVQTILSVGSNINPAQNIAAAQQLLAEQYSLLGVSDVIETSPVGYQAQPNFLNAAILLETSESQQHFNQQLKRVEDRLGRVRGEIKSGPRTMDLDIIVWDGLILTDDYRRYDYVSTPVNQLVQALGLTIHF